MGFRDDFLTQYNNLQSSNNSSLANRSLSDPNLPSFLKDIYSKDLSEYNQDTENKDNEDPYAGLNPWEKQQKQKEEMESLYTKDVSDLSSFERAGVDVSNVGKWLMSFGGATDWLNAAAEDSKQKGDWLGSGVATVASGALGLFGAIPGFAVEGVGKGIEAITGTPVTEANFEGTKIADYKLNPLEQAMSGIGGGVDIALSIPGLNVAGTAAKGLGKLGLTGAKEGLGAGAKAMGKVFTKNAKDGIIKSSLKEGAKMGAIGVPLGFTEGARGDITIHEEDPNSEHWFERGIEKIPESAASGFAMGATIGGVKGALGKLGTFLTNRRLNNQTDLIDVDVNDSISPDTPTPLDPNSVHQVKKGIFTEDGSYTTTQRQVDWEEEQRKQAQRNTGTHNATQIVDPSLNAGERADSFDHWSDSIIKDYTSMDHVFDFLSQEVKDQEGKVIENGEAWNKDKVDKIKHILVNKYVDSSPKESIAEGDGYQWGTDEVNKKLDAMASQGIYLEGVVEKQPMTGLDPHKVVTRRVDPYHKGSHLISSEEALVSGSDFDADAPTVTYDKATVDAALNLIDSWRSRETGESNIKLDDMNIGDSVTDYNKHHKTDKEYKSKDEIVTNAVNKTASLISSMTEEERLDYTERLKDAYEKRGNNLDSNTANDNIVIDCLIDIKNERVEKYKNEYGYSEVRAQQAAAQDVYAIVRSLRYEAADLRWDNMTDEQRQIHERVQEEFEALDNFNRSKMREVNAGSRGNYDFGKLVQELTDFFVLDKKDKDATYRINEIMKYYFKKEGWIDSLNESETALLCDLIIANDMSRNVNIGSKITPSKKMLYELAYDKAKEKNFKSGIFVKHDNSDAINCTNGNGINLIKWLKAQHDEILGMKDTYNNVLSKTNLETSNKEIPWYEKHKSIRQKELPGELFKRDSRQKITDEINDGTVDALVRDMYDVIENGDMDIEISLGNGEYRTLKSICNDQYDGININSKILPDEVSKVVDIYNKVKREKFKANAKKMKESIRTFADAIKFVNEALKEVPNLKKIFEVLSTQKGGKEKIEMLRRDCGAIFDFMKEWVGADCYLLNGIENVDQLIAHPCFRNVLRATSNIEYEVYKSMIALRIRAEFASELRVMVGLRAALDNKQFQLADLLVKELTNSFNNRAQVANGDPFYKNISYKWMHEIGIDPDLSNKTNIQSIADACAMFRDMAFIEENRRTLPEILDSIYVDKSNNSPVSKDMSVEEKVLHIMLSPGESLSDFGMSTTLTRTKQVLRDKNSLEVVNKESCVRRNKEFNDYVQKNRLEGSIMDNIKEFIRLKTADISPELQLMTSIEADGFFSKDPEKVACTIGTRAYVSALQMRAQQSISLTRNVIRNTLKLNDILPYEYVRDNYYMLVGKMILDPTFKFNYRPENNGPQKLMSLDILFREITNHDRTNSNLGTDLKWDEFVELRENDPKIGNILDTDTYSFNSSPGSDGLRTSPETENQPYHKILDEFNALKNPSRKEAGNNYMMNAVVDHFIAIADMSGALDPLFETTINRQQPMTRRQAINEKQKNITKWNNFKRQLAVYLLRDLKNGTHTYDDLVDSIIKDNTSKLLKDVEQSIIGKDNKIIGDDALLETSKQLEKEKEDARAELFATFLDDQLGLDLEADKVSYKKLLDSAIKEVEEGISKRIQEVQQLIILRRVKGIITDTVNEVISSENSYLDSVITKLTSRIEKRLESIRDKAKEENLTPEELDGLREREEILSNAHSQIMELNKFKNAPDEYMKLNILESIDFGGFSVGFMPTDSSSLIYNNIFNPQTRVFNKKKIDSILSKVSTTIDGLIKSLSERGDEDLRAAFDPNSKMSNDTRIEIVTSTINKHMAQSYINWSFKESVRDKIQIDGINTVKKYFDWYKEAMEKYWNDNYTQGETRPEGLMHFSQEDIDQALTNINSAGEQYFGDNSNIIKDIFTQSTLNDIDKAYGKIMNASNVNSVALQGSMLPKAGPAVAVLKDIVEPIAPHTIATEKTESAVAIQDFILNICKTVVDYETNHDSQYDHLKEVMSNYIPSILNTGMSDMEKANLIMSEIENIINFNKRIFKTPWLEEMNIIDPSAEYLIASKSIVKNIILQLLRHTNKENGMIEGLENGSLIVDDSFENIGWDEQNVRHTEMEDRAITEKKNRADGRSLNISNDNVYNIDESKDLSSHTINQYKQSGNLSDLAKACITLSHEHKREYQLQLLNFLRNEDNIESQADDGFYTSMAQMSGKYAVKCLEMRSLNNVSPWFFIEFERPSGERRFVKVGQKRMREFVNAEKPEELQLVIDGEIINPDQIISVTHEILAQDKIYDIINNKGLEVGARGGSEAEVVEAMKKEYLDPELISSPIESFKNVSHNVKYTSPKFYKPTSYVDINSTLYDALHTRLTENANVIYELDSKTNQVESKILNFKLKEQRDYNSLQQFFNDSLYSQKYNNIDDLLNNSSGDIIQCIEIDGNLANLSKDFKLRIADTWNVFKSIYANEDIPQFMPNKTENAEYNGNTVVYINAGNHLSDEALLNKLEYCVARKQQFVCDRKTAERAQNILKSLGIRWDYRIDNDFNNPIKLDEKLCRFSTNRIANMASRDIGKYGEYKGKGYYDKDGLMGSKTFAVVSNAPFLTGDGMVMKNRRYARTKNVRIYEDEELDLTKLGGLSDVKIVTKSNELINIGKRLANPQDKTIELNTEVYNDTSNYNKAGLLRKTIEFLTYTDNHTYDPVSNNAFCSMQGANMVARDFVGIALATSKSGNKQYVIPLLLNGGSVIEKTDSVSASIGNTSGNKPNKIIITRNGEHRLGTTRDEFETAKTYGNMMKGMTQYTDNDLYLDNGCLIPVAVPSDNINSNNILGSSTADLWDISSQLIPVLSYAVKDHDIYKFTGNAIGRSHKFTEQDATVNLLSTLLNLSEDNKEFQKTQLGYFVNKNKDVIQELINTDKYNAPADGNLSYRDQIFWQSLGEQDFQDLKNIKGFENFQDKGLATFLSQLIKFNAAKQIDPRIYLDSKFMSHYDSQYITEYLSMLRSVSNTDAPMYTRKLYESLMPKGKEIYSEMMTDDGLFKVWDQNGEQRAMKVILRDDMEGDPYSAAYNVKPDGTLDVYADCVSLMKGGSGSVKDVLIALSQKNGNTGVNEYKAYREYIGLDRKKEAMQEPKYSYIDYDPEREIPFVVNRNSWILQNVSSKLVKKFETLRKSFSEPVKVLEEFIDKEAENKTIDNLMENEKTRNALLPLMEEINRRIGKKYPDRKLREDDPALLEEALREINDEYGNFLTADTGTSRPIPLNDFVETANRCTKLYQEGKTPGYSMNEEDLFWRTMGTNNKPKGEQRISVTIADLSRLKRLCELGIIDESFLEARENCLKRSDLIINKMATDMDKWSYDSSSPRTQAMKDYMYFTKYALGEELHKDWIAQVLPVDEMQRLDDKTIHKLINITQDDLNFWKEMNEERIKILKMEEEFLVNDNQEVVTGDNIADNNIRIKKDKRRSIVYRRLKNAADLAMGNGMGFEVGAQNVLGRGWNFYKNHALLTFGRSGKFSFINPLKHDRIKGSTEDFKRRLIENKDVQNLKQALDVATFLGREDEFLIRIRNRETTPDAFLKEAINEHGQDKIDHIISQYKGWMTRIFGGEWSFKKKSVEVWYEMWMMEAWRDPRIRQYLEATVDEAGNVTRWSQLEGKYADDPLGLAMDMMASSKELPFIEMQRKVLNNSREGDYAHNNAPMVIYDELCRLYPGVKPVTVLVATRFLRAQSNVMGSRLGWVLPMRTLNKIACKAMSSEKFKAILEKGPGRVGKELRTNDAAWDHWLGELEKASGYGGWRANIMCDLMKMTLPNMAMALAACIAFQPPADDDHWSNYREWTIFGVKVENLWWIDDLLGFALPMAAFWKSVELGKPRFDIISKGYAQVAANNPIFKAGNALSALFDPDQVVDENNLIQEIYKKSPDQVPTQDVINAMNNTNLWLTWIGNVVDPYFLKEFVNWTNPYDVDYTKIAVNNQSKGIGGHRPSDTEQLQATTYEDAMIRKVTKNNPVLALWFDTFNGDSTTGYGKWEQANKYILDTPQQEFLHEFSIFDYNNNKYKSETEMRSVATKIIDMLNSTDDMSGLYHKGFLLDDETREYVAYMLEQSYESIKEQYNQTAAAGYLNFYTLGDGDYALGQERYNEYITEYTNALKNIQSLYNDKLMSDELNQGWQKYKVPTQTWYVDDNGKPYRSGHQTNISNAFNPINIISGGPENAGREGSFAQLSAVTGTPMYDMNGNPIRTVTAVKPTKNNQQKAKWATETISLKTPSSYSGGSGYGRSGGGGGGGRSIYSHAPNLNIDNSAAPRATRLYDTNFDYLRPNFEVAGSREAYKRDTI